MSAIYFKAAMMLVNSQGGSVGYSLCVGNRIHRMHWTRRTQIMSFCEKKLSMKLGQR